MKVITLNGHLFAVRCPDRLDMEAMAGYMNRVRLRPDMQEKYGTIASYELKEKEPIGGFNTCAMDALFLSAMSKDANEVCWEVRDERHLTANIQGDVAWKPDICSFLPVLVPLKNNGEPDFAYYKTLPREMFAVELRCSVYINGRLRKVKWPQSQFLELHMAPDCGRQPCTIDLRECPDGMDDPEYRLPFFLLGDQTLVAYKPAAVRVPLLGVLQDYGSLGFSPIGRFYKEDEV